LVGDVTRDRATVQLNNLLSTEQANMTPLIRALINHMPGSEFVAPPLDDDLKGMGLSSTFTSYWGPPGTGKTMAMSDLARDHFSKTSSKLIFMTAPHNNGVASLSKQLSAKGVKHWIFINPKKRDLFETNDYCKSLGGEMFTTDFRHSINRDSKRKLRKQKHDFFFMHSTIVLMTVPRAISITAEKVFLRPDIMTIDEVYVLPLYLFMSTTSLNYRALVVSGDPKQHPPYVELDRKNVPEDVISPTSTSMSLSSIWSVFPLKIDNCIILGAGAMRMPQPYVNLFGAIFYNELPHYHDVCVDFGQDYSYTILGKVTGAIRMVINSSGENLVINAPVAAKVRKLMGDKDMVVTPYIGQAAYYNHNVDAFDGVKDIVFTGKPIAAHTMRAAQGLQADWVALDTLKRTCFLSMTNASAAVALSRHTVGLYITHVPSFSMSWLSANYFYDDSKTVRANYENFIANVERRGFFTMLGVLEHGWDHPIKWRFFIWLLEYIQNKKAGRTNGVFNRMRTEKMPALTYVQMLECAVNDAETLSVLLISIQNGDPIQLVAQNFRNPENYQRYVKARWNTRTYTGYVPINVNGACYALPMDQPGFLREKKNNQFYNLMKQYKVQNVACFVNFAALYDHAYSAGCDEPYEHLAAKMRGGDPYFPWMLIRTDVILLQPPIDMAMG